MEFLKILWLHCQPRVVLSGASLQLSGSRFFAFPQWYFFLVYFRIHTICHKGDTLCSFGQGTTAGLPFIRKGSVGEAPRRCFG